VDKLQAENRRLEIKITGLESEVEEAKAARADHLGALQLVDLLERRLERHGINATAQLQKIRKQIKQSRPEINLTAVPVNGSA
jgi:hypothetical protein